MTPRRFSKILVLGSGALKIGEAGEFDYSGTQAIKAFKQEAIATVLVNPNIATIQTSEHLADKVFLLPVQPNFVEQVIAQERPDGIALAFGGQTALNCGVALERMGVLKRYGVSVVGTPVSVIEATEDRQLFADKLRQIDVKIPRSGAATTIDQAVAMATEIGYPVMVRAAFALGGLGSGACRDEAQLRRQATLALSQAPQVLVEEYLTGWKEIEYEVVRDAADNCIVVCNMENFDPMGIHTGESIVVAPSQTLTNHEYHLLREIALKVIRHLGVVGECNIQYALNPQTSDYRVIEVNARLSRSSALASKATGYPLAFVAAKLGLGYSLPELRNQVTGTTTACFEPALDYVVVKMPRWDLQKYRRVSHRIGSVMKSVGEVMAIGRKFEEALQKAVRMLETGALGLVANEPFVCDDLPHELSHPSDQRILAIVEALQQDYSVDRIHELTHVNRWFLHKIMNVVELAKTLQASAGEDCSDELLRQAKCHGFSDRQIAKLVGKEESQIRTRRHESGLRPVVKRIDTLAAEYPAQTSFLYLTYNGDTDDVSPSDAATVGVLGSGVYRIGSSVEFDWCCVNTLMSLRKLGYRTVMVNCNPETVSTDYDECDQLYFEELTLETLIEIYAKEKPLGLIVSMGGQTPNNLARKLQPAGIRVLGTPAEQIDLAENRRKFSDLLDDLGIEQPLWAQVYTLADAEQFAERVGYPVLVRPSYVLSGQAMGVAANETELAKFLHRATAISHENPVVLTKFMENAKEFEYDAVAKNGEILSYAISEHVENAGVHSGDATLVLPPQRAWLETIRRIRRIGGQVASALAVTGPLNIQFLAVDNEVLVIECNLRASRSFPFVSKMYGINYIDLATRAIVGAPVQKHDTSFAEIDYVGVKAPHFSFTRLEGADPVLGVEMNSTGEVACFGSDFEEALLKAMLCVGYRWPIRTVLLSTGPLESKAEFMPVARLLAAAGIQLFATPGTADFMKHYDLHTHVLHWPTDPQSPNVLEYLAERRIDLVINIPKNFQEVELTKDYVVRRKAVDYNVPLITDLHLAKRFCEAVVHKDFKSLAIKSWGEYLSPVPMDASTVDRAGNRGGTELRLERGDIVRRDAA